LLEFVSDKLLGAEFDDIIMFLQRLATREMDNATLFAKIKNIPLTAEKFNQFLQQANVT